MSQRKNKPVVIAGLGGKDCPEEILKKMSIIGGIISGKSWWLRSGHSEGGDYAFEKGADGRSILYLPHKGWGEERPYLVYNPKRQIIYFSDLQNKNSEIFEKTQTDIAKFYHKSWKRLSGYLKFLLCRIYILLLGAGEVQVPANVLICYLPPPPRKKKEEDKKKAEDKESEKEGEEEEEEEEDEDLINDKECLTLAMKIADDFDIPVINLGDSFYKRLTVDEIFGFIEQAVEVRDQEDFSLSNDSTDEDIDEEIKRELAKVLYQREKERPKGRVIAVSEV